MPRSDVEWDVDWQGEEIELRFRRATGRGTIALGEGVSGFAKQYAHVGVTGNLRRSIHVAKIRTLGEIPATIGNVGDEDGAMLDVGSWLDYACVEEVGRGHTFMMPAVETIRGHAMVIMRNAFAQEGFIR